ncbi:MAG: hypothetical protein C4335_03645 [Armatimonadota bacterium]
MRTAQLIVLWGALLVFLGLQAQSAQSRPQPLFQHVRMDVPITAPAMCNAQAYQPVRIRWQLVNALQPNSRFCST